MHTSTLSLTVHSYSPQVKSTIHPFHVMSLGGDIVIYCAEGLNPLRQLFRPKAAR